MPFRQWSIIEPIDTHYGFNLDEFKVVSDTITVKRGDSFGELMMEEQGGLSQEFTLP